MGNSRLHELMLMHVNKNILEKKSYFEKNSFKKEKACKKYFDEQKKP